MDPSALILSFSVVALLTETRFALLKPEDTCPKQNLKISQSQPQKTAKKQPITSSNMAKNKTNILPAPTKYLADIST